MHKVMDQGARALRTLLTLLLLPVIAACSDPAAPTGGTQLTLTFTKLEPLANGFHYEGWAVLPSGPVSTGKFNVNSSGALVTVAGAAIVGGSFATKVDAQLSAFTTTIAFSGPPAANANDAAAHAIPAARSAWNIPGDGEA